MGLVASAVDLTPAEASNTAIPPIVCLCVFVSIITDLLFQVLLRLKRYLPGFFEVHTDAELLLAFHPRFRQWLTGASPFPFPYSVDLSAGHNRLCALYLKHCGNKSIAVEHQYHDYLRAHGPVHLRSCSRGLMEYTKQVRKIDETSGIRGVLPYQIGFLSGLQELYARRVGLCGILPEVSQYIQ